MNQRSRSYCLTINNYTEEDVERIKNYETEYVVVGDEIGESGTPHLQIYFRMKNAKTFSKIKKDFTTAHIEIAKGDDNQNKAYCSKQNLMFEKGEPKKQGKRTDIEKIRDMVQDGNNMRDILPIATSVQSVRMAEIHLKYYERKRNWKPKVYWFYGETGTGKSKLAYEMSIDPYVTLDTIKWWEGYDGHAHVIIDDMRGDFAKYHQLLKLLDRYEYKVECKGGSRQFLAEQIIITSCDSPHQMFSHKAEEEDLGQLLRRIDELKKIV
jgi:hypothetical protein